MKKNMKTFPEIGISPLKSLVSVKKKYLEKIFAVDGVSFTKLKIDFRKIFVNASLPQNLQKSGFSSLFHPIFPYKNNDNF